MATREIRVKGCIQDRIVNHVPDQIHKQVRGRIWDQIEIQVWDRVWIQIEDQAQDKWRKIAMPGETLGEIAESAVDDLVNLQYVSRQQMHRTRIEKRIAQAIEEATAALRAQLEELQAGTKRDAYEHEHMLAEHARLIYENEQLRVRLADRNGEAEKP